MHIRFLIIVWMLPSSQQLLHWAGMEGVKLELQQINSGKNTNSSEIKLILSDLFLTSLFFLVVFVVVCLVVVFDGLCIIIIIISNTALQSYSKPPVHLTSAKMDTQLLKIINVQVHTQVT